MGEKYLGNIPEVAALNGVRNLIVESTTNGIKKIPTSILKRDIYKDLPIDPVLSDTSENAVKNKVIKSALDTKANSIISTSSGTVFHETDCAAVPPINIKLFGKGKQDVIAGNQLFDASRIQTITKSDVSVVNNGDGSFTISGDGSITDGINAKIEYKHEETIKLVKSGTLTLLLNKLTKPYCYVHFYYDNDNKRVDITCYPSTKISAEITEEMLDDTCRMTVGIFGYAGDEIIGGTIKPMLYQDGDGTWEPFVGGEQSPNMKYPQIPVHHGESGSIGGKVYRKNLFDKNSENIVEGLFVSDIGSLQAMSETRISDYIGVTPNSEITVSGMNYPYNAVSCAFYDKDRNFIKAYSHNGVGTRTLFVPSNAYYFRESFDYRDIDTLQIEIGSTATNYEPYTEQPFTVQTPNGLRGIPLGKTIPDAIKNSPIHMNGVYWDSVEGQYYIGDTKNEDGNDVQRIGKERLLADKVHIIDSLCNEESNLFWLSFSTNYLSFGVSEFLCDIVTYNARGVDGVNADNGALLNAVSNYMFYIRLRKDSGISTLEEFKEYLTNNEVFIYIILKEPIITDTTEEEKAQLDNVVMNYPNTTIVNDAGAYMEVEYVCDTKCYIDKLEKKHEEDIQTLKNAILSLGGNI